MAVCILGVGIYYSAGPEAAQPLPEKEIVDTIQTQYPGKVTNVNLAQDKGVPTYEAELTGENKKFALHLDASSGKVLELKETKTLSDEEKQEKEHSKDSSEKNVEQEEPSHKTTDKQEEKQEKKAEQDKKEKHEKKSDEKKQSNETASEKANEENEQASNQTEEYKKKKQNAENNPVISKQEAVEKALEQFSGNVDDIDLEDEDGRLYYEIEIERGDLEAEIMIDAYTGEVLIIEIDD